MNSNEELLSKIQSLMAITSKKKPPISVEAMDDTVSNKKPNRSKVQ